MPFLALTLYTAVPLGEFRVIVRGERVYVKHVIDSCGRLKMILRKITLKALMTLMAGATPEGIAIWENISSSGEHGVCVLCTCTRSKTHTHRAHTTPPCTVLSEELKLPSVCTALQWS